MRTDTASVTIQNYIRMHVVGRVAATNTSPRCRSDSREREQTYRITFLVKTGSTQVFDVNRKLYAGSSWDELKHVRQSVGFLACPCLFCWLAYCSSLQASNLGVCLRIDVGIPLQSTAEILSGLETRMI